MSMTRTESIKYFALQRFAGKSIEQALDLAPAAVRHGLHSKDLDWIKRHADLPAWDASQRLLARGHANPDGACEIAPRPTDKIIITAPAGTKARWVNRAQAEGQKLSNWIISKVDRA